MKFEIFLNLIQKLSQNNNNLLINNKYNNIIHYDIYCSECKKLIIGIRYKCSMCFDYNLCSKCEENNKHKHDFFVKKHNENEDREKEVKEIIEKLKEEYKFIKKFEDIYIIKKLIENNYDEEKTIEYLFNIYKNYKKNNQ